MIIVNAAAAADAAADDDDDEMIDNVPIGQRRRQCLQVAVIQW